ncbi:MAG: ATP-binding cassette domain-containing protein [Spirochaetaceae bacterium]|jgi:NitT/TauT family transport system ATP-binding protein|nr:ATP-binding cassette domain-containing protein [Spirochaetaceae bacterium]
MIELKGLSYTYPGGLTAFHDVDAEFADASISALIGPSGCGKTSLIKCMAGLLPPERGTMAGSRNTAVIFQHFGLLPWKTVLANAELPLRVGAGVVGVGLKPPPTTAPTPPTGG